MGEPATEAAFPFGLTREGVHEVAEMSYGDLTAAAGFTLAALPSGAGPVLWVSQTRTRLDHGHLYQSGLGQFNADPPMILTVRTRKRGDALWAIEEAICSKAVGIVIAEIDDLDFTASRRLTLASDRHGVPVVLLMPYTKEGASAAQARWRVRAQPSAPNPYDAQGLGRPRWRAVLERSRQVPHLAGRGFDLELDDETFSLNLVSKLASDTPQTRAPGRNWATVHPLARRAG